MARSCGRDCLCRQDRGLVTLDTGQETILAPAPKENPMPAPTPQQILDTPMPPGNDAGAKTVRGYLVTLLAELWRQEECFSGKRPFGNSGWAYDVYGPLAKAGLIEGTFDEDGYIEDVDVKAADRLILAAIATLAQDAEQAGGDR